MKVQDIIFEDSLGADGDIEVVIETDSRYPRSVYLNKKHAEQIIQHLSRVFELDKPE